jgi:adenine/guanine phosphoribosyltransferase-like PRPP-binding protein
VTLAVQRVSETVEVDAKDPRRAPIMEALRTHSAVLTGHFGLHRRRHATSVLRFRGIGRDPEALELVVAALLEGMPAPLRSSLKGAKVLCPETAGFFLGSAIADACGMDLAISQTDLHRLPVKSLLSGSISRNERVVIVNDVAGTGASVERLRELVVAQHAKLEGIILFGVVDDETFRKYCASLGLPAHWLVTAKWAPCTYTPDVDCPGCKAGEPLEPVSEIV